VRTHASRARSGDAPQNARGVLPARAAFARLRARTPYAVRPRQHVVGRRYILLPALLRPYVPFRGNRVSAVDRDLDGEKAKRARGHQSSVYQHQRQHAAAENKATRQAWA